MPDTEGSNEFSSMLSMVSRSGERMASLETRQTAIEQGIAVIRSAIHEIKNDQQRFVGDQQRFVAAEVECARKLGAIDAKMAEIVAATPRIEQAVAVFESMRDDLRIMSDRLKVRRSIWGATTRVAAFVAASVAAVAGIVAVVSNWPHFSLRIGG